jgi:hypothetical protein
MRDLEDIETELDKLQISYIAEDDDQIQMDLDLRFTHLLEEATALDGVLRREVGVTICNWVRS